MTGDPDPTEQSSFDEGTARSERALHGRSVSEVPSLVHEREVERVQQIKAENALARGVANGAVVVGLAQVVVADVAFFVYGAANHWRIPAGSVSAWLGAVVIQVLAVVLVVVRYLFPARGRSG